MTARNAGSFTSGESEAGDRKGAHRSANKSPLAGFIRDPVRGAARDLRGCKINFMNERAKIGIVDHALKEFLIFAPAGRFALKKEIVQADGGAR